MQIVPFLFSDRKIKKGKSGRPARVSSLNASRTALKEFNMTALQESNQIRMRVTEPNRCLSYLQLPIFKLKISPYFSDKLVNCLKICGLKNGKQPTTGKFGGPKNQKVKYNPFEGPKSPSSNLHDTQILHQSNKPGGKLRGRAVAR